MFIIQNGKITSDKTLDIGKSRIINLVFESDLDFADDDKFKLVLGDIQSENFAFVNNGCLRFSYVDLSEIIKKASTDLSVKVTCNGSQILADSITITAYVQGGGSGEEIKVVVFNNIRRQATEIKIIPFDYTKKWTNFYQLFAHCVKLTTIPQFDTSNGTNFSSMCQSCEKLTTIPKLNTSNGTNFSYMFYYDLILTTIPQIDTSNGTNFYRMFQGSKTITTIPQLDVSNGTNLNDMFYQCSELTNFGGLLNVKTSYSLISCNKLSYDSLLNVLNGLADLTGGTSQKLTLGSTNLAKLTDEEKAIATNKNWTLA